MKMPENALPEPRAPILALTADLLFASRVKSTAAAVGTALQLARTAEEVLRLAAQIQPRLIVIDLDTRSLDPVDLIRRLKATESGSSAPVLAYVSHVREDLIGAARAAGADQVMARGAFTRNLAAILSA